MNYKTIYYFVNPRYFRDSNQDGIGDLIGLAKQSHYFKLLNVNTLILSDIFDEDPHHLPFSRLKPEIGSLENLKKLIKHCNKEGLKVMFELPLSVLSHNYLCFKKAVSMATNYDTRELYLYEELTKELSLNSEQTLLTNLLSIITFWLSTGINGFVLRDFEYLGNLNQKTPLSQTTIKILKDLYLRVKSVNKNCLWIGLSHHVRSKLLLSFTTSSQKLFDEVICQSIAYLKPTSHYQNQPIKFKNKHLVKSLKHVINHPNSHVMFSTAYQGRLVSRWGDDLSFWKEANKCLALIFYLNKNHNNIFYGDELGLPNYVFQSKKEFYDHQTVILQSDKQSQGISDKKILQYQEIHHHLHTKQAIPWNSQKYGGFSSKKNPQIIISPLFKEINVSNQILDEHSVLDFHRKLIALTSSRFFHKLCKYGTFNIRIKKNGVIVLKGKHHFDQFRAYINLSLKTKNITFLKLFNSLPIVLSTYQHRQYPKGCQKLNAYEGIMLLKTSKDYLKSPKDNNNVQNQKST